MAKQSPELDEATRRIAERMLNTPPKPHDQMKVGKAKRAKAVVVYEIEDGEIVRHYLRGEDGSVADLMAA